MTIRRIAIIGAGVAGLSTARALTAEGYECTVFDRAPKLGGVWAIGYAGFGVQVPKELYEFPELPLPDTSPKLTPGPRFQQYLEEYTDRFGIRGCLRLGTSITDVSPREDGDGWTVTSERGGRRRSEDYDFVVVATGLFSNQPFIPDLPGRDRFEGEVLHTSDIADASQLAGKRIAVVGYGKSAADIVRVGADAADEAHWIFRDVHWPVPQKLAGLIPFKWGLLTRMASLLIPAYVRPSPLARALHGVGAPLVWFFWRLVELLLRVQWGLGRKLAKGKNLVPSTPVEIDAFSEATMLPPKDLFDAVRAGSIAAHRTEIRRFTDSGIVLADGDELEVDAVVFGTGWRSGYGFLESTLRAPLGSDADGFYLYRHMLHPSLDRMAFIGRVSSFQSVLTHSIQARWLVEYLRGAIELPSDEAMLEEIEADKAWKRSFMPAGPGRGARLLLHMTHYHDELLRDFGEQPFRKTGLLAPLKELVVPYQAGDYRDLVRAGDAA